GRPPAPLPSPQASIRKGLMERLAGRQKNGSPLIQVSARGADLSIEGKRPVGGRQARPGPPKACQPPDYPKRCLAEKGLSTSLPRTGFRPLSPARRSPAPRPHRHKARGPRQRPRLEELESRAVPSVTAHFEGSQLVADGDGSGNT